VRSNGTRYVHLCDTAPGVDAQACRRQLVADGAGSHPSSPVFERAQCGRVRLSDGHVVSPRAPHLPSMLGADTPSALVEQVFRSLSSPAASRVYR